MHTSVLADAPCFIPGNFKKDVTVRLSHGRPHGHRPIVRPSVRPSENVRVTTLEGNLPSLFLVVIVMIKGVLVFVELMLGL
jgi:hypothetical protein